MGYEHYHKVAKSSLEINRLVTLPLISQRWSPAPQNPSSPTGAGCQPQGRRGWRSVRNSCDVWGAAAAPPRPHRGLRRLFPARGPASPSKNRLHARTAAAGALPRERGERRARTARPGRSVAILLVGFFLNPFASRPNNNKKPHWSEAGVAAATAAGVSGETAAVAAADRGPGRAQGADTPSGGCGRRRRRFCCCCSCCCCWCRCRRRRAGGTGVSASVCARERVRGRVCARVCGCLRVSVCLCGDSGAGGSGSPGGAAAAAAARAPALLAAQVRSARHFVRFTKSSSGRSRLQQPPFGARPRRRRPPRRAGPRGPAAGTRGPGTAVFAGEGAIASPAPGAAGIASRGETEQAAARPEAGAPGAERGGRGGAGCGGRGGSGSAAREPEAETHRRKRRERPAIVPKR
ncbi:spidroin-1-like [Sapajus apella]|uniref:Spidroin-1-like n=1 Tax=Sapajus apella TaxID=9515 RepID=A0A6J3HSN2_SAPAP|nr:spidroin-1-like [Sapajus apella]